MILILGGGLAGMSTAYHLGDRPHLVLEGESSPGGLCRTRVVDGYHFDYTGHLLHLRDPRAIELVDAFYPDVFDDVGRVARIRSMGADLPFPYQANLHGLPREFVAEAIVGFTETLGREVPDDPTTSFRDWALAVFGPGIARGFMFNYNRKLFRREPEAMTADWVSWAVPKPNLEEVVRGALGLSNEGMGYNPTFRYPRSGGIGVIPDAFAERMTHLRCDARVVGVDLDARTAEIAGGETVSYDRLVVTTPLPGFLSMCRGGPVDWAAEAARLDWSVVGCVNLGVERAGVGDGVHWIYFPDPDVPFYRVGFPSNFSAAVAPPGTSSLYVEFGLRRDEPFDPSDLEDRAIATLVREGILRSDDPIAVRDTIRIDPGYVIFDRARQEVMARVIPALEALGVHPIGRYGAWTYSYMERAILDGLELAERI
jgi:protoporphyrinogen oxidase